MPSARPRRVAVIGATGFVGSAIARHLEGHGLTVVAVRAPRIDAAFDGDVASQARTWSERHPTERRTLEDSLAGADAVVNAAGIAQATATASGAMWGANAVLPRLIADILAGSGDTRRYVHVSSAAVQGSTPVLDESPAPPRAHSPYATSKAAGERGLSTADPRDRIVVYRPTSVLGTGRPLTRTLATVLRARWLVVPDDSVPLPITTDGHVAEAVRFLLECDAPPAVVLHPWEGVTTSTLAAAFGRRGRLHRLPRPVGVVATAAVRFVARGGPFAGHARRLELLWAGQRQRSSMGELGFTVPDDDALERIGAAMGASGD